MLAVELIKPVRKNMDALILARFQPEYRPLIRAFLQGHPLTIQHLVPLLKELDLSHEAKLSIVETIQNDQNPTQPNPIPEPAPNIIPFPRVFQPSTPPSISVPHVQDRVISLMPHLPTPQPTPLSADIGYPPPVRPSTLVMVLA